MAKIVASKKYQKDPMIVLIVIDYLKNIEDNCQIFRVWLVTLLFFKYRTRKQMFFNESGGTDEASLLYRNSLEQPLKLLEMATFGRSAKGFIHWRIGVAARETQNISSSLSLCLFSENLHNKPLGLPTI